MSTRSDLSDVPRLVPDRRPPAARAHRQPRLTPVMPEACQTGGCGGPSPAMPPPPSFGEVLVGGVEIAPEAIAREIQHHPAPDAETAWRSAARALAIRQLLLSEARSRGIEAEPEHDDAGRLETEEEALIRTLLDEAVEPEEPDEAECRRFYDARASRFRTPDLFEAAHVLIEPEGKDTAAWEVAEARARAIVAEVGDDPEAFAAVARELSACPTAIQDGSLGQVSRGELLPAVQAALEDTLEGTVRREPVRSPHGWHVLRLHRRIEGRTLPFEAVAGRITEILAARSWSLAATRLVVELADNTGVEGIDILAASPGGRI